MSGPPLVSIIVPVHNGGVFVGHAIRSVLAQSYRPIDIVVIDDGSTDDSAGVAERFGDPVRVWRQPNGGPPAARNRGLSLARGPVVGFLDADDLYAPDKLTWQVARLQTHPDRDIVIGRREYRELVGDDPGAGPVFAHLPDDHLSLQLGCALFRRPVFDRVGPLDETMWFCDDWDWFLRARELGVRLLLHHHVVLHQRVHTGNITRRRQEAQRFQLRMLKRSIDRRRQGGGGGSLPALSTFFEDGTDAEGAPDA
jgi:glycosyltransferase involved in cell wall biosynthesis